MLGSLQKYVEEMRKEFSKTAAFPRVFKPDVKRLYCFASDHEQNALTGKRSRASLFFEFTEQKNSETENLRRILGYELSLYIDRRGLCRPFACTSIIRRRKIGRSANRANYRTYNGKSEQCKTK